MYIYIVYICIYLYRYLYVNHTSTKYLEGHTESSLWIRDLVVISLKNSNMTTALSFMSEKVESGKMMVTETYIF